MLIVTSIMFIGCGEDNKTTTTTTNTIPDPTPFDPAFAATYIGEWKADCEIFEDEFGNPIESMREGFIIEDGRVTLNREIYTQDGTCANMSEHFVVTYNVSAVDAGLIDGIAAYNIDGTYGRLSVTPLDAPKVTELNTIALCGHTNWTIGVTKNLSESCSGTIDINGKTANWADLTSQMSGDFFDIIGISDSRLYIGERSETHTGEAVDQRPIVFDLYSNSGAVKQP